MSLNLISRANVKTHLGINVSTYDSQIDAMIPIVSSDIRRIIGNGFDEAILAVFSSSSTTLDVGVYNYKPSTRKYIYKFNLGQVVYHPNLPADTYLSNFDHTTGLYTLSATPTGTGDYIVPTVTISQFPTIAKMIWYRISQQNTTSASNEKLQSVSVGPVSKTYAESEINKQYNYPQILIDDLGIPYARIGS